MAKDGGGVKGGNGWGRGEEGAKDEGGEKGGK